MFSLVCLEVVLIEQEEKKERARKKTNAPSPGQQQSTHA